jgi:hypothetical protein
MKCETLRRAHKGQQHFIRIDVDHHSGLWDCEMRVSSEGIRELNVVFGRV